MPETFRGLSLAGLVLLATVLGFCSKLKYLAEAGGFCGNYDYGFAETVAAPKHPPDVCVTKETVTLGRHLFYEKDLSRNRNQSCASCHKQSLGFSDGLPRSIGSTGKVHPRNSLSIANPGYFSPYTWANPALNRLDNQTLIPFFSENTLTTIEELAITGREHVVAARLRENPKYPGMFRAAFGEEAIDVIHIARAIAAFEITMISLRSPFDRKVLSAAAERGKKIFESDTAGCYHCHGGPYFNSDEKGDIPFANIGLYNVGNKGDYPDRNLHGATAALQTQGIYTITTKSSDRGKFKTPSLRNVAVSAPYMHDGSVATLREVVDLFDSGGRNIRHGVFFGDGRKNPNKDPRIRPLGLTESQKSDLLEFLRSLTDDCFLTDPLLSDPEGAVPVPPEHCARPSAKNP
ncbi:cytochrome-c peroxidase [Leptospira fluminis]|uniref:Cytochrome-c peroxidase n=1 Tax=Leptospira fluminis TaxID=2484979 RepID=A0A4R9GTI0_9LEPT|nr:cytochrome c peroxidase [Leptospira fluminis]TGK20847.1 cytochrome-c peroxidase [Leptospira fluminis]